MTAKKKQDAYTAKMKKQLDKLGTEVESLEKKSRQATKDLKAEYQEQLKHARAAQKKLQARVKKLGNASEDKWDKVKDEVDHAWGAFVSSVNYFRSKFK